MRPQKAPAKVAEYKAYRALAHKGCLTFAKAGGRNCKAFPVHGPRDSEKKGRRYKGPIPGIVDEDDSDLVTCGDDTSPEISSEEYLAKRIAMTAVLQDVAREARPVKPKGIAKDFVFLPPPSRVIVLEDDDWPSPYDDDWEKI